MKILLKKGKGKVILSNEILDSLAEQNENLYYSPELKILINISSNKYFDVIDFNVPKRYKRSITPEAKSLIYFVENYTSEKLYSTETEATFEVINLPNLQLSQGCTLEILLDKNGEEYLGVIRLLGDPIIMDDRVITPIPEIKCDIEWESSLAKFSEGPILTIGKKTKND